MKNWRLIALFFLAVIQLGLVSSMILKETKVINQGTEYRIQTRPVDPTDLMRGKYIALNYIDQEVHFFEEGNLEAGDEFYMTFTVDDEGFARPDEAFRSPPDHSDYISLEVERFFADEEGMNRIYFNYPFDRFYMEESKAYDAEILYRDANWRNEDQKAYAVIFVQDGNASLTDVQIDGRPIKEMVEELHEARESEEVSEDSAH
jgi:uncharacterized membrane-anchored protein